MTKSELSLLIFLETCHTDYGGPVDIRRMNTEDLEIAKRWNDDNFIEFGRIYSGDLEKQSPSTHYAILSDAAMEQAHAERKERATRMLSKRSWRKASEK